MKDRKVIKRGILPAKLPLFQTLTLALALDYWKAPGWAWGACGLLTIIIWVVEIMGVILQEEVDIFEEKEK